VKRASIFCARRAASAHSAPRFDRQGEPACRLIAMFVSSRATPRHRVTADVSLYGGCLTSPCEALHSEQNFRLRLTGPDDPYIRLTAPIVVPDKVRLARNPLRASIGA
jgi:hypothetical protein